MTPTASLKDWASAHPRTVSAAKLALGLALAAAALAGLDRDAVAQALSRLQPAGLAAVVLLVALEFPILGWRWILMVGRVAPLPWREHMRLYLVGIFLSSFTPAQVGGDLYRFVRLSGGAEGKAALAAVILRERLLGLATFLGFYLVCLGLALAFRPDAVGPAAPLLLPLGGACAVGLVALAAAAPLAERVAALSGRPWLAEPLRFLAGAARMGRPGRALVLTGLSLLGGCGLWAAAVIAVAVQVGAEVPWLFLAMAAVAVELVRLVPLTAQGIGVREAAFAALFAAAGFSAEQGFVVGAVAYVAASLAMLLAGVAGRLISGSAPSP
ncbi:MAG: lysylphosphatidylglycerol synthase domain-containing protein [Actinomycetota bacterium]